MLTRSMIALAMLSGCRDDGGSRRVTQRELDRVIEHNRAEDEPLINAQRRMCSEVFAPEDVATIVGVAVQPDEHSGTAPSSVSEARCAYRTANDKAVSLFVICGIGRMSRDERRAAWKEGIQRDPFLRGRILEDTKTGLRIRSADGAYCMDFEYVEEPPCDLKLVLTVGGPPAMDALVGHVKSRLTKANAP